VAGELAQTKETLAAKETSIGEVDSRIRSAEEQAARAEAELRAGVTVREEVARLIETELKTARSELAIMKQQHEEAQRQLESGRSAEAERDAIAAERDAIAAERDALRGLDDRSVTSWTPRRRTSTSSAARWRSSAAGIRSRLPEPPMPRPRCSN
jgi:chromosome segregation ATPase